MFQHTAARRRLVFINANTPRAAQVSTHSRPKAAGYKQFGRKWSYLCFNTQPPEGGWRDGRSIADRQAVSTHSRPKAAGRAAPSSPSDLSGFNTQPPEGGWSIKSVIFPSPRQFQHTAARRRLANVMTLSTKLTKFQHTAARRRLVGVWADNFEAMAFQHTAARRRLGYYFPSKHHCQSFQHTAARRRLGVMIILK